MSDTISKRAVLDKFQKICDSCGEYEKHNGVMCGTCYLDDAISFVEDMPSAQPEEDCNTCKHGYFGSACCNNCMVRFPNHYERRTDGSD